MRDGRIAAGIPRDQVYQPIFLMLAAMLVVGFVANLFVKPVASRFHMPVTEGVASTTAIDATTATTTAQHGGGSRSTVILAWLAVGVPILWGIYMTLSKAVILIK